jgi:hypothetical protein
MALEDNQKIGIGLICLGLAFVLLGVVLLFDSSLIAIGNALFLAGLCFAIGFKRTINLFTRYVKPVRQGRATRSRCGSVPPTSHFLLSCLSSSLTLP